MRAPPRTAGWLTLLAGVAAADAGGDSVVEAVPLPFHRGLPHAYHDQAMASLPRLYPELVVVASRRVGQAGGIVYSMVCYRPTPRERWLRLGAVAVRGTSAWRIDATAVGTDCDGLMARGLTAIAPR